MHPSVALRRLGPAAWALVLTTAIVALAAWTVRASGPPRNPAVAQTPGLAGGARATGTHRFQEVAEEAALKGTWVMVDYQGSSPADDILCPVNRVAEAYGVPDTNGIPGDPINDNVLVYYVYIDGSCVPLGEGCWELHAGPNVIPAGARGLRVNLSVPLPQAEPSTVAYNVITATAAAHYVPDGGLLPVAVNEYWLGSAGFCPYDNCGQPYSFVRDPAQEPPFRLVSSSPEVWAKNACPNPYNNNVCQGPYGGAGGNFGRAFALLGPDAKPNYGSMNPRGGAMLDCRYDALNADQGNWWYLLASDSWSGPNTECPMNEGEAAVLMAEVILAGGYGKVPLPGAVLEPPTEYIADWSHCWALPYNEDNCFNFPANGRTPPFEALHFLNGSKTSFWPDLMYDGGMYVDGRYAPGERILVTVYNSVAGYRWGSPASADTTVLVGYAGAIVVGYGSRLQRPCVGTPGDWQSYVHCIVGQPDNLYGLISAEAPLTMDPTRLLYEWLAQRVELIPPR